MDERGEKAQGRGRERGSELCLVGSKQSARQMTEDHKMPDQLVDLVIIKSKHT